VLPQETESYEMHRIRHVEKAKAYLQKIASSFSADQIYKECEERPIEQRHHGWFIGFAPAHDPKITVAVLAEHACHGSTGGAPVVRDVIWAYMKKYHPELLQQKRVSEKIFSIQHQPKSSESSKSQEKNEDQAS